MLGWRHRRPGVKILSSPTLHFTTYFLCGWGSKFLTMGWLVLFASKTWILRDIIAWGAWAKDINSKCIPLFGMWCIVLLPELVPAPSWNPITSSPPPLSPVPRMCSLSVCPMSTSRPGVASPSSRWIVLSLPHSKVLPCGLLLLVLLLLPTGMLTWNENIPTWKRAVNDKT